MNFIITEHCNKGCPYCFAAEHRKESQEKIMSLDQFKNLLDTIEKKDDKKKHIKLLGGEPTMHPDFSDFLDELVKRDIGVTIISNFLFSDKIKEKIIETTKHVTIDFLVNATNLDERNLIEKWAKNYNDIYYHLYHLDKEQSMSVGYTFEQDKSWRYYVQYTDFLLQYIPKIERLRLSLPYPGERDKKEDFFFINNYELGEKFLIMTKKAIDVAATPSIDCIVYPCMFENKEEYKFVSKFAQGFKIQCDGAPSDVFPNGDMIYCYPTKDSLKVNVFEFDSMQGAIDSLIKTRESKLEAIEKPETCKSCRFLHKGCEGPCLGFYDPEKIKGAI